MSVRVISVLLFCFYVAKIYDKTRVDILNRADESLLDLLHLSLLDKGGCDR
jgi:hypothetical protein